MAAMRALACLPVLLPFAAAASAAIVQAPDGEAPTSYVLVGPAYQGIAEGVVPPAHTLLSTDGEVFRFTFASYERGDPQSCAEVRKCSRYVEALTLRLSREADNTVHVIGIERPDRDAIFRTEFDEIYLAQIARGVDGARLEATPGSLTFHNDETTLRFLAGDGTTVEGAFALADAFNVVIADADLCLIRQLATFAAGPPSPARTRVLNFAAFAAELAAMNAAAGEGGEKEGDPPTIATRLARQIAIFDGARPLLEEGWRPIDEEALVAMIAAGIEATGPLPLEEADRAAVAADLDDHRAALAAGAEMIGASLRVEGDLLSALCRDLTLGLP